MLLNDIYCAYIQQLCTIGNGEVADSYLQYIHRWLVSTTHVLWYMVPVEWSQVQFGKNCWVFWHL